MRANIYLFFLASILFVKPALSQDLERYLFQSNHMGTRFNVVLYADSTADSLAKKAADEAFARIEELNQIMSDYEENSELNRLSRTSGSGEVVGISDDLFTVLKESERLATLSDGLFDITIGPMSKFWRVIRRLPDPELPGDDELHELRERVGYQNIRLDEENQTAKLLKSEMQLDLGGIAKGYAAEEALKVLKSYGIERALIDAGGDVTLGNSPPERDFWNVVVPKNQRDGADRYITLQVADRTVTTSGDLFQFVEIDGKRYSHIINPKTGLGTTNQIQATVIAPSGMTADALASILTLMDSEKGIELINEMDETEAIIFMNEGEKIREWYSDGARDLLR